MAKSSEGSNEQRRTRAREAQERGESPSEAGVTLGASKQRREVDGADSHQEKLEARDHGKQRGQRTDEPRPGGRETDPKRTDRYE